MLSRLKANSVVIVLTIIIMTPIFWGGLVLNQKANEALREEGRQEALENFSTEKLKNELTRRGIGLPTSSTLVIDEESLVWQEDESEAVINEHELEWETLEEGDEPLVVRRPRVGSSREASRVADMKQFPPLEVLQTQLGDDESRDTNAKLSQVTLSRCRFEWQTQTLVALRRRDFESVDPKLLDLPDGCVEILDWQPPNSPE